MGPARGEPHTVCARRQPWYDGGNRSGHDARPKMATAITSLWLFRPSDGGGACAHNRTRRERRPGTPDRARGPAGAHRGRRIVPSGRGSGPARREWWAGLCWTRVYETKSRTGLALRAPRKNSGFDPAVSRRAAFEEGKRSVSSPFGGKMVRRGEALRPRSTSWLRQKRGDSEQTTAVRSRRRRFGADDSVPEQSAAPWDRRQRRSRTPLSTPLPHPGLSPRPAGPRDRSRGLAAPSLGDPGRGLGRRSCPRPAGRFFAFPFGPVAASGVLGLDRLEKMRAVCLCVESRPHAPLFARRPSRPAASAPLRRGGFRSPWLYPSFAHSHHSRKRAFAVKITIESDTGREVFRPPSPGVSGPTARLHSAPPRPCRRDRSRLPHTHTARGAP